MADFSELFEKVNIIDGDFNAHVETIAHFSFIVAMKLLSEKAGNILRLDGVNQGFKQVWVNSLQILLAFKDDVGGVLGLHDTPMIVEGEGFDDGAILLGKAIELTVQLTDVEALGQEIGPLKIGDEEKSVAREFKCDMVV